MKEIEKSIFALEGEEFAELVSDLFVKIRKNNLKYKAFIERKEKIMKANLKLRNILEDQEAVAISFEECEKLIEILTLKDDMRIVEEKELFFLGGKEAYNYFKNIDIIK